jgi:hypothetical protein
VFTLSRSYPHIEAIPAYVALIITQQLLHGSVTTAQPSVLRKAGAIPS